MAPINSQSNADLVQRIQS